jgi:hypothetical protein
MEPEKAILSDAPWLKEANEKANLIRRCMKLKPQLSSSIYQELLRVYEAKDKYLNQLEVQDLVNFTKDLEAQYQKLWKGTKH